MPTEVTTGIRRLMSSRVAGKSSAQQHDRVIAIDKAVVRQDLSETEQVLPSTRDSEQSSNEELDQTADDLNNYFQNLKRDLYFSVDEDTGETIIKVVDSESQKLIRTIPSDEFIHMSRQLNQSVGMLLNTKV